jgi:ribosomal protein S18 acetylase RimI-like enzyme
MDIQIVSAFASEQDLKAFKDLLLEYAETRSFDKGLGNYRHEIELLEHYYGAPGTALLGNLDGMAVATVACKALDERVCEMKRLYVQKTARGRGLAQLICKQLMDEAKRRGFKKMRLDTHPKMQAAQQLYEKIGFYRIGRYNNNPISGISFYEIEL